MKTSDREILKGYYWNHDAIRKDVDRLKRLASRASEYSETDWPKVKKWFDYHKQCLHEHHMGEDNFFFPKMRALDSSFSSQIDIMDQDHKELVRLINALDQLMPTNGEVQKLSATIAEYAQKVISHLDREEVLVESVISKNLTKEETLEIEEQYRKSLPRKTLELMMPWMVDAMDDKDRAYFFKMVPVFVKWIYRASMKKKYNRMVGVV